jgi:aryl-alcohol dehydrogenase-like predicted oxidoreductase
MRFVTLPGTDLAVSRIALGSSAIGTEVSRPDSFAILDAFVEAGGTFVDTAHVYANWAPGEKHRSEKTIGAWLKATGLRDRIVLATKGGHPDPATPMVSRLSPAEIVGDLDSSLECLGVERVDLYWLHRDQPSRPVGEMLDALHEQVLLGKIRYIGCSNWRPARIREAQAYAAKHGITPFVASQIHWSLAVPNPGVVEWDHAAMDDEAAAFYASAGLAVVGFTSQARGFFTKAGEGGMASLRPELRSAFWNPANLARLRRARELASQLGTTVTAVVLAYIASHAFVGIPIIGPVTLEQARDSLRDCDLTLTPEMLRYLVGWTSAD